MIILKLKSYQQLQPQQPRQRQLQQSQILRLQPLFLQQLVEREHVPIKKN